VLGSAPAQSARFLFSTFLVCFLLRDDTLCFCALALLLRDGLSDCQEAALCCLIDMQRCILSSEGLEVFASVHLTTLPVIASVQIRQLKETVFGFCVRVRGWHISFRLTSPAGAYGSMFAFYLACPESVISVIRGQQERL